MRLIDKFYYWKDTILERYQRWYWNSKPHKVTCRICGETLSSKGSKFTPEEQDWEHTNDHYAWICPKCLWYRNFIPYVPLVDIDNTITWHQLDDGNEERRQSLLVAKKTILQTIVRKIMESA